MHGKGEESYPDGKSFIVYSDMGKRKEFITNNDAKKSESNHWIGAKKTGVFANVYGL
jgi:hypothetical protein